MYGGDQERYYPGYIGRWTQLRNQVEEDPENVGVLGRLKTLQSDVQTLRSQR